MPVACPDESSDRPRGARAETFVQATLACIGRYGYHGTTVRRIAERAGVTPGLLVHYFSGKDALIAEAYAHLANTIMTGLQAVANDAGADPADRLRAFIGESFSPRILNPELLRIWVGFWSPVTTDEAVRKVHEKTAGRYRRIVEGLIAPFVPPGSAPQAAIGIAALLDGLWLAWCLDPDSFDPHTGRKIALDMTGAHIGVDLS